MSGFWVGLAGMREELVGKAIEAFSTPTQTQTPTSSLQLSLGVRFRVPWRRRSWSRTVTRGGRAASSSPMLTSSPPLPSHPRLLGDRQWRHLTRDHEQVSRLPMGRAREGWQLPDLSSSHMRTASPLSSAREDEHWRMPPGSTGRPLGRRRLVLDTETIGCSWSFH